MVTSRQTLALFRILVHISPVIMGAIVYFVLTSLVGLEPKLAAIIAFVFAVLEWLAFSMVLKTLEWQ